MSAALPPYFFRVKDNGALVFRVDTANRQRRLTLEQIATVNVNNGQVKPQGDRTLTSDDEAAIARWMEKRRADLARRTLDDIQRAVDHLNLTAHWAQSRATDEDLDAVTNDLLLAMHDLREVLVRKRADRLRAE
ncbi:hypothetical protein JANAI62_35200 [Jannaschia pagri]|uniref:Uncharacterized protein n=1 Tax=Jannaschia pagri TaxID=2829797 RepID=A0ABQ4NS18_9RHOB|nr:MULTISPECIES: hypothetical protein [unclassified Jannaschia]GIT93062.1 hypothetical protein JANAI61_35200 [Jannaschia sp. AI_61]GIT96897.1 hypothetical protein JANAI62_35200 [Jannaschia sp. AI_62]